MTTRLSVNVNDETARAVKELAAQQETSATDIVRKAIAVYRFIEDETAAGKELRMVGEHETTTVRLV